MASSSRTSTTSRRRSRARSAAARPRGAARREALIEATLRVVADAGADAVTHRRVAEAADLPLASTTYWFDSKDDLLTAALALAAQRDMARLRACVQELDARTDVGAADIAAAVAGPVDEDPASSRGSLLATYALLLEAARRPPLQAVSREWTEAYLTAAGALLARAGSARPRDDARLIVATLDGLLIDQLAVGETADPRPELARLAAALLEAS